MFRNEMVHLMSKLNQPIAMNFQLRTRHTSHEHHYNQNLHVNVHLNQMFQFDLQWNISKNSKSSFEI